MIRKFLLLISILILVGCGGGDSSSSLLLNTKSTENITAVFIDSAISGVEYKCLNKTGFTDKYGKFTCPKDSSVEFFIGGIDLGSAMVTDEINYLSPAELYGLESSNISDNRLINFIRFIQSLDSDNDPSNGIEVNQKLRDSFMGLNLDLSDNSLTEEEIEEVLNTVSINIISKNDALQHYVETLTNTLDIKLADEPYFYQQWYLAYNDDFYSENNIDKNAHISANGLLHKYTGKGIKIAIIDNGLDTTHEELEGAISDTYSIFSNSNNVTHTNEYDYHGTSVTGIIAARYNGIGIQGIASNSQVYFLKFEDDFTDSDIYELFKKAEEFGADIINCSWGTYNVSPIVEEKIKDLATNGRDGKGTIIVFASGNDNKDMGNDESNIQEVISVGATDKDNLRAWYSNYGKNLDIVAPAGDTLGITTIDPTGNNGQSTIDKNYNLANDNKAFSGTSAAAPIVTGAIALILEKNPNLTRSEIEEILKNNADKLGSIAYENGRNDFYGYGKINLKKIFEN